MGEASRTDRGDVEAVHSLYVYPPEEYFETLPLEVTKCIMAHFDKDTFGAMCMRELTPFRDHEAGLFTRLVINSESYVLSLDPSTETIEMGDRVSAHAAVHTLRKHGAYIWISDVEFRRGSKSTELHALIAKYCRPDKPLRVPWFRNEALRARAELDRRRREASTANVLRRSTASHPRERDDMETAGRFPGFMMNLPIGGWII